MLLLARTFVVRVLFIWYEMLFRTSCSRILLALSLTSTSLAAPQPGSRAAAPQCTSGTRTVKNRVCTISCGMCNACDWQWRPPIYRLYMFSRSRASLCKPERLANLLQALTVLAEIIRAPRPTLSRHVSKHVQLIPSVWRLNIMNHPDYVTSRTNAMAKSSRHQAVVLTRWTVMARQWL